VSHDQVQGVLSSAACGPAIALEADFATGKLREYVMAGALLRPVSYGSSKDYARFHYDSKCRYFEHNHPLRIKQWTEWGDMWRKEWVEELREKTTPNFDPLESALANTSGLVDWGGFKWIR